MTARHLLLVLLACVAGLLFSCRERITSPRFPPYPPASLRVTAVTHTTVSLSWQDRSGNETGFVIYREQAGGWLAIDTAAANRGQCEVGPLQPGTSHRFRVTAYNEDGESAPSNEVTAQTTQPQLPNPPTDVAATAISSTIVRLTWTDRGTQDSFLIQRRETQTLWAGVGATVDNVVQFHDSSAQPQTQYFYRVGAKNENGTSWSLDSAEVTTFPPGAPLAPDSLQITVVLGTGVILEWRDRSGDEDFFEIGRGSDPQALEVRDAVFANVTTYTDSLRDTAGVYYYGVRAGNEFGRSNWAVSSAADYRYCSDGVIPICLGNYWQYRVDSIGGTDYDLRRTVLSVEFAVGLHFYLLAEGTPALPPTDTLYYLRNFTGEGCYIISYPLGDSPLPELLFRYPALPTGSRYVCQRDTILVLMGGTGGSWTVGDTTYSGVIAFQRFFTPTHSVQYFIKPQSIGIIQEREYRGTTGDPQLVCQRDIRAYRVQN